MISGFEPFRLTQLGRVAQSLEHNHPPIHLVGVHSYVSLGLILSQSDNKRLLKNPRVVITPDLKSAELFTKSLKFFDPQNEVHVLPPFDVDIYSNLYPNQRVIASRLHWLYRAMNALPGETFVASIESLLQQTLPYSVFAQSIHSFKKNMELPTDFASLMHSLGYNSVPTVEDIGTYSIRGNIVDVFSPSSHNPFRLELIGDTIESIRSFDPKTQMSVSEEFQIVVLPAKEVLYSDDNRQEISKSLSASVEGRDVARDELQDILRSVSQAQPFYGMDFLLPYFYKKLDSPLDYFSNSVDIWFYDHLEIVRTADQFIANLKINYLESQKLTLRINYLDIYKTFENLKMPEESTSVWIEKIHIIDSAQVDYDICEFKTSSVDEVSSALQKLSHDSAAISSYLKGRVSTWLDKNYSLFVSCQSHSIAERLKIIFELADFQVKILDENNYHWQTAVDDQKKSPGTVHFVLRAIPEGFRSHEDHLVFLKDEDILGKRNIARSGQNKSALTSQHNKNELEHVEALSFGDLKVGDLIVHRLHGIGIYDGLKVMKIDNAETEFIELRYKDNDRLYIPMYRVGQINKYSGPSSINIIDKLGGTGWAKTQIKVRNQLRDVADSLLRLYAKRAEITRPPFSKVDNEYHQFENSFPYQETDDQLLAINDILSDLGKPSPMDRLVCGDVGFGKTEVAMRAAFMAVEDNRQVAIIAPTTILTHQHCENFKKRFKNWPVQIRALNRFVAASDVKETLAGLKDGKIDIVIGTHRLLSKDVSFKNLGLLIIDEEQKFGVIHKERLRRFRENVDTLTLSATPIPRTLNMSLSGIRDLSLINTPPEDRLPTRTFVCKFDDETIRKAIESEIDRGGQIFFLHNRVQTIAEVSANIRRIAPKARIAIGHGQMDEHQLETTMLKFFNHEIDVLVCTSIIESGMDIPRANTIFIDNAHTFGLSQLYQLRGRVGRSKERAYCYLLLPKERRLDATALERLRVIQENTALGSGLRVAQYDLELRGAGDLLGEDQSGHINAVGYDLYFQLLAEAVQEQKGELKTSEAVDPEINLKISALFPDKYIPDIRMRLYYYKTLSNIRENADIDRIEQELSDQFGPPPEPVLNLLGIMLIRKLCRDLGVRDVSAGKEVITLLFSEQTRLPTNEVIRLSSRENKKYSITPEQKLKVRMKDISWPKVVSELEYLISLCSPNK